MKILLSEHFIESHYDFQCAEDVKRASFILSEVGCDQTVLDLGCGTASNAILLAQFGNHVTAVDIDHESIYQARKKLSQIQDPLKIELELIDFRSSDSRFLQKKYDRIVCSEVLEHFKHPEKILQILSTLLNENGKLIITVPNGFGPQEQFLTKPVLFARKLGLRWLVNAMKSLFKLKDSTRYSHYSEFPHVHFFKKSSLVSLVASYGYKLKAFRHSDSIQHVFPFSLLYHNFKALQKFDCKIADALPAAFASGFYSSFQKT